MASSTYSDDQHYRSFYPLPPVTTPNNHTSRPNSAQSPWSATSGSSAEHLSLTLPSLTPPFTPGDLAEDPSLYELLQSPATYLPAPSVTMPRSHPQGSPIILPRSRPQAESYRGSDTPDLFLNFEDSSLPQSPQPLITRASSIVDLTESSPTDMSASSRKRKPASEGNQTPLKRRLGATPTGFDESSNSQSVGSGDAKVEELDMVEVDSDPKLEEFRKRQQAELIGQQNREKADKPVKLTDFQCIICLDSPTDLTVTHCGEYYEPVTHFRSLTKLGHLFCSLCLHEALHAGTQKKTCPVCRQQINTSKNKEGKPQKNGVFVLEMKLMTARRKEKQPQGVWR